MKKRAFFYCFFRREYFLTFAFYLNVQCIQYNSENIYFHISKNITSYTFVACFQSGRSLQCILKVCFLICDAMRDLLPFVRIKNVKNTQGLILLVKLQPKACNLTLLNGCFSRFLNCTNGIKSRKASYQYYCFWVFFSKDKGKKVVKKRHWSRSSLGQRHIQNSF